MEVSLLHMVADHLGHQTSRYGHRRCAPKFMGRSQGRWERRLEGLESSNVKPEPRHRVVLTLSRVSVQTVGSAETSRMNTTPGLPETWARGTASCDLLSTMARWPTRCSCTQCPLGPLSASPCLGPLVHLCSSWKRRACVWLGTRGGKREPHLRMTVTGRRRVESFLLGGALKQTLQGEPCG